ncbi:hypothetical protein HU200_053956 [Digitaria exilis]|uniref:Uncharacterized protein n=1 Tax=Digitaria exilis TaxID=1010633 RepID=A0A835AGH1_9POAL|nr:hypothetical protein HU200_053956 [Digitaria exilis]
MAGVADAIGLISSMISIAEQLVRLAERAQRNREMCAQLKNHVQMISRLLTELRSQWMPDPVTYSMLKNLSDALNDGKALVASCQEKRTWSLVFKTQKKAKKIAAVDARISKILEPFHIANMILIVSINKERFVMTVLEKLLQHGACRNLPQSQKEELKSSIKNLANMDNMSTDAKRVMECIVRDLAHGTGAAPSPPVHQAGGSSSSAAGNAEVVRMAVSVVQEAKALRHSRPEIQLLVQFVRQIGDLMQQPQSWELSRDPNTEPMVNTLREHLQDAFEIVSHNEQHRKNKRIAQKFLCGVDGAYSWQQPDNILKVAYRIEYYVQVLPVITMRQMLSREARIYDYDHLLARIYIRLVYFSCMACCILVWCQ